MTSFVKNYKKDVKILLDSGASGSIVAEQFVSHFKHVPSKTCTWETMAGSFRTTSKCVVEIILPELNPTAKIRQKLHVVPKMSKYDILLGRDVMQQLGISLDFEDQVIHWNGNSANMKSPHFANNFNYNIEESYALQAENDRLQRILDAKYEKANLLEITKNCTHVSTKEQKSLYFLLRKFEKMFDGQLGKWTGKPSYDIELKPGVSHIIRVLFPSQNVMKKHYVKKLNTYVKLAY